MNMSLCLSAGFVVLFVDICYAPKGTAPKVSVLAYLTQDLELLNLGSLLVPHLAKMSECLNPSLLKPLYYSFMFNNSSISCL